MNQSELMRFDPATGEPWPYHSHAEQWREHFGYCTAWLFNPWTGERRNARDVGMDILGRGIQPPKATVYHAHTHIGSERVSEPKRWIAVQGPRSYVTLMPVGDADVGPDIFAKSGEVHALAARLAEAERLFRLTIHDQLHGLDDDEMSQYMAAIDRWLTGAPSSAKPADSPRPVLLDRSLRERAHELRREACSAWSDVVTPPHNGLSQAKCDYAAATEARLKAIIDELADGYVDRALGSAGGSDNGG